MKDGFQLKSGKRPYVRYYALSLRFVLSIMILGNGREGRMSQVRVAEARRSTRVPLKIVIRLRASMNN
jgi:hypothetical protein